jgi:hypothetical protein
MNAEYLTVWQAGVAGLGLVAGSFFYSLGGRRWKGWRRFIGSSVLAGTVCGVAAWRGIFNPWMLVTFPALVVGFSLGYGVKGGGTETKIKILKRVKCCLAVCLAGLVMALCVGGNAWWVLPFHVGVALFSVYLGLRNPIEAAAEEFFICLILNTGLMAYAFVGVV